MRLTGKQHYAYTVSVDRSGRIAFSYQNRIAAVIGNQEIPASYTALEHALYVLAFLHKLELAVLLLEETVLNKVKYYVQAHATHGMSL